MVTIFRRYILISLGLGLLAACGGGGGGEPLSPAPVDNGLPFAQEGDTLEQFQNRSADVTVVRHVMDYDGSTPRIVIGLATLTVGAFQGDGPLINVDPTMTLEFGGETLSFVEGSAIDEDGKLWSAYISSTGDVSGTAGFYHYDYGSGVEPFDTEGLFAFGFLTDPETLVDRDDIAAYSGNWFGYGVVTNGGTTILQNEAIGGGTFILTANFEKALVSGTLTGSYDSFGRVDGALLESDLIENAFAGDFALTCGTGATCSSNTVVGGAFFGFDGAEVSGAIGFDERRTISGDTRRLVSSAGYTLSQN